MVDDVAVRPLDERDQNERLSSSVALLLCAVGAALMASPLALGTSGDVVSFGLGITLLGGFGAVVIELRNLRR